jgi:hypothetical protein
LWLRSSRFSQQGTKTSPSWRFPFKPRSASLPKAGPDYHSVHTLIPVRLCICRQSRSFPRRCNRLLASFAEQVSSGIRHPPTPLKAGYAAHSTNWYRMQVYPSRSFRPRTRTSAEGGSTPTCHCRSPFLLNSQHQPPTGRRKPAPGTSSMCR